MSQPVSTVNGGVNAGPIREEPAASACDQINGTLPKVDQSRDVVSEFGGGDRVDARTMEAEACEGRHVDKRQSPVTENVADGGHRPDQRSTTESSEEDSEGRRLGQRHAPVPRMEDDGCGGHYVAEDVDYASLTNRNPSQPGAGVENDADFGYPEWSNVDDAEDYRYSGRRMGAYVETHYQPPPQCQSGPALPVLTSYVFEGVTYFVPPPPPNPVRGVVNGTTYYDVEMQDRLRAEAEASRGTSSVPQQYPSVVPQQWRFPPVPQQYPSVVPQQYSPPVPQQFEVVAPPQHDPEYFTYQENDGMYQQEPLYEDSGVYQNGDDAYEGELEYAAYQEGNVGYEQDSQYVAYQEGDGGYQQELQYGAYQESDGGYQQELQYGAYQESDGGYQQELQYGAYQESDGMNGHEGQYYEEYSQVGEHQEWGVQEAYGDNYNPANYNIEYADPSVYEYQAEDFFTTAEQVVPTQEAVDAFPGEEEYLDEFDRAGGMGDGGIPVPDDAAKQRTAKPRASSRNNPVANVPCGEGLRAPTETGTSRRTAPPPVASPRWQVLPPQFRAPTPPQEQWTARPQMWFPPPPVANQAPSYPPMVMSPVMPYPPPSPIPTSSPPQTYFRQGFANVGPPLPPPNPPLGYFDPGLANAGPVHSPPNVPQGHFNRGLINVGPMLSPTSPPQGYFDQGHSTVGSMIPPTSPPQSYYDWGLTNVGQMLPQTGTPQGYFGQGLTNVGQMLPQTSPPQGYFGLGLTNHGPTLPTPSPPQGHFSQALADVGSMLPPPSYNFCHIGMSDLDPPPPPYVPAWGRPDGEVPTPAHQLVAGYPRLLPGNHFLSSTGVYPNFPTGGPFGFETCAEAANPQSPPGVGVGGEPGGGELMLNYRRTRDHRRADANDNRLQNPRARDAARVRATVPAPRPRTPAPAVTPPNQGPNHRVSERTPPQSPAPQATSLPPIADDGERPHLIWYEEVEREEDELRNNY